MCGGLGDYSRVEAVCVCGAALQTHSRVDVGCVCVNQGWRDQSRVEEMRVWRVLENIVG